jgi:hypothetical protein
MHKTNLLTVAPIVAVCAIALWFLMNALAPVIPDWGQAARGYLQRILIGVIVVGAATTLVTAFMALGAARRFYWSPADRLLTLARTNAAMAACNRSVICRSASIAATSRRSAGSGIVSDGSLISEADIVLSVSLSDACT